jgi:hypothetical protein
MYSSVWKAVSIPGVARLGLWEEDFINSSQSLKRDSTYQDVHLWQHVVCCNQVVRDPYSVWLHGMTQAKRIGAHIG